MPQLGIGELVIILVIVIVLFGRGRIRDIAGEIGGGIRAFRKGLQDEDKKEEESIPANDQNEISSSQ